LLGWLADVSDPLQRATAVDLATWLPDDLLVKLDRMTMAHSLEGRAPFLRPDLIDIALNLPQTERMSGATSKVALRRVARKFLPNETVDRAKHGFVLPMREWLAEWFQSRGTPEAYATARRFPYVNEDRLAALVNTELKMGVRRERLLFAIVMLLEWWHTFHMKLAQLNTARYSLWGREALN